MRSAETLENFGEVPHAEELVRLLGNRQEVLEYLVLAVYSSINKCLQHGAHVLPNAVHPLEAGGDGLEDGLDRVAGDVGIANDVEVPDHAWTDDSASAPGDAHGAEEEDVDDLLKLELVHVVPAPVIEPLPDQFQNRL